MKISLSITGVEDLNAMRAFLDPKNFEKAQRAGLQYASRAAKAEAAKRIRASYTINTARVKDDISGPFIPANGTEATLVFSRKAPSILQYGGRDTGKGLTAAVIRGRRARIVRGFIVRSGPLAGRPFRRTTDARTPIDFVSGPSIGSIFAGQSQFGEEIRSAVSDRIQEQFAKGFERKLGEAARRFAR